MILEKEQINRYLRHIIMPEISGPGQKKLLDAKVYVYGENVEDTSVLLYYLAASGIGHILCRFEDNDGYEELFDNVRDLNSDVSVESIRDIDRGYNLLVGDNEDILKIVFGGIDFVIKNEDYAINSLDNRKLNTTIIALSSQWCGGIQVLAGPEECRSFIEALKEEYTSHQGCSKYKDGLEGSMLSSCLLGALCAIEVVKLVLNLGEASGNKLYFNIFEMEFSNTDDGLKMLFERGFESDKYSSMDKSLSERKVLIVGAGGLGSPVAYTLAKSGIGTIGLIDSDKVEVSNLNRQILHSTSRIGMPKVESARVFLQKVSRDVKIVTYDDVFSKDNAEEIIKDYDVIVDGVDNFQTRFLLNDACYFLKKPMIEAGVLRFNGLNMTIIPDEGPCYRCVIPKPPAAGSVPTCSESGVLGPVPGVMGFIQAAEVIKLLTAKGRLLANKMLYYEALDSEFFMVNLNNNPHCPLCSTNPLIRMIEDYKPVCNNR